MECLWNFLSQQQKILRYDYAQIQAVDDFSRRHHFGKIRSIVIYLAQQRPESADNGKGKKLVQREIPQKRTESRNSIPMINMEQEAQICASCFMFIAGVLFLDVILSRRCTQDCPYFLIPFFVSHFAFLIGLSHAAYVLPVIRRIPCSNRFYQCVLPIRKSNSYRLDFCIVESVHLLP